MGLNPTCEKLKQQIDSYNEAACRQSAKGVLTDLARKTGKKANAIETLIKVIPWQLLSPEDDEVLWDFFCSLRNN